MTLNIAIAGGSLGGLTAALRLRAGGHNVDVFERSTGALTGFGAGIVAHEVSLRHFAEKSPDLLDRLSVSVGTYRLIDGTGALLWQQPVAYRFVSWGSLYRALLAEFGPDHYHQGAALVGHTDHGDGVELRFSNGETRNADLLVLADGVLSSSRQRIFPDVEPTYAGYVAWRGTVSEKDMPADMLDRIDDAITYALIPNSHVLIYPIPGLDGSVRRGERLWNFVWYRNVEAGPAFQEFMTDRDGFFHAASLRPGQVQDRYVAELKAAAEATLPQDIAAIVTATEQPFIQAVMDLECPATALGRVTIIGDAAFAVRPHAAAGTAKAAENAWTLAEALDGEGNLDARLREWSRHQTALGRLLIKRVREVGAGSQFRCDWTPGDPNLMFGLYEPGDSSDWERKPSPSL